MNISPSVYQEKNNVSQKPEIGQQVLVDEIKLVPFFSTNSPKDLFYSKAIGLIQKNQHEPLPSLGKDQVIQAISLLTITRKFQGRENSFEIEFTLAELFQHILNQKVSIDKIELVGSGVPFVLGPYVYDILQNNHIDNPNDWLPHELLDKYNKQPRDFDFRVHAPAASIQDIQRLKHCIVDFFVEKKAAQSQPLHKPAFRTLIMEYGFTNFSSPKNLDESLMSVVGFHDAQNSVGIDLVIYQKLDRESLFIYDGLFLNWLPLCDVLKKYNGNNLIESIQNDSIFPSIIPRGIAENPLEALFDRIGGVIRANKPETINCAGWPNLIISYLKGNRCLTSDLEKTLLNKVINTLNGTKNVTDMPTPLRLELKALPKDVHISKKIAKVVSYWLKKSFETHLDSDSTLALPFILQACVSLYQNGHADSIQELWTLLKPLTEPCDDPLMALIVKVMDSESKSFEVLTSMLEVKAFLYLLANEKNGALISHFNKPALQFQLGKHVLLLPYNPAQAILNLNNLWKQCKPYVQDLLEQLNNSLQPKAHYIKNDNLPSWSPVIHSLNIDYSKPWDRVMAEWQLACELSQPSTNGSKLAFNYLISSDDPGKKRLIKSAALLTNSPVDASLYPLVLQLMDKEGYSTLPLPLIWSMALASTGASNLSLQAYSLWKVHSKELPPSIKGQFTKLFFNKLSVGRPDLATELLTDLESNNLSFKECLVCLSEIKKSLKKNIQFASLKTYLLLAQATAKLLHQYPPEKLQLTASNTEMIEWLFSYLVDYGKLVLMETKDFCLKAAKTLPIEAPIFKKMTEDFLHSILQEYLISNQLEAAFKIISLCRSPSADLWNILFEKIQVKKNKDLWLEAWSVFCSIDPCRFKGNHSEIANTWYTALKTMPTQFASHLLVLLGKEDQILQFFEKSKFKHSFTKLLYSSFLEECEKKVSEESLKKLLKFRENIASTCSLPYGHADWRERDFRLAKLLAGCSLPEIGTALIILHELDEQEESRSLINTLLKKNITHEDIPIIGKPLLKLSTKLKDDKYPFLSKFYELQNVNFFIRHAESEFLSLLNSWIKQLTTAKVSQKQLQQIFTHVLSFYLFQALQHSDEWERVVHHLFSMLRIDSIRQDLKQMLIIAFNKLATAFDKYPNSKNYSNLIDLYKNSLESSYSSNMIGHFYKWMPERIAETQKSELPGLLSQFYELMELASNNDMIFTECLILFDFYNRLELENLESESFSVVEVLLNKLKKPDVLHKAIPLLLTSKNIQPQGCIKFIETMKSKKDVSTMLIIWEIFWNVYVKKDLLKSSNQLNQPWIDVIEALCASFPDKLFYILANIEDFCKSIDYKAALNLTAKLLGESALALYSYKGEEQKNRLNEWINASERLRQCCPEYDDCKKESDSVKLTAFLIAGDVTQFQWAIKNIEIELSYLSDFKKVESNLIWLIRVLNRISSEKRKDTFNGILRVLIKKMIEFFPSSQSDQVLFEKICNWFIINGIDEEKLLILSFMCSVSNNFMLDTKTICLIESLRERADLNPEKIAHFIIYLNQACQTLVDSTSKISNELSIQFTTKPFVRLSTSNEHLYFPLLEMIFNKLPPSKDNKLTYLDMVKEWVPYFFKNNDHFINVIEKSVKDISDLLKTDFKLYSQEFIKLKEIFSLYDRENLWSLISVKTMLADNYNSATHFLYASSLIDIELRAMLACDSLADKNVMLRLMNEYVFLLSKQDLSILNIKEDWYAEHQKKLRDVLIAFYNKGMVPNTAYFQYACFTGDLKLLNKVSALPGLDEIPITTQECCFKNIFSDLLKSEFSEITLAVNIVENNGKYLPPKTVEFCWNAIINHCKKFDKIAFKYVHNNLIQSSFLSNSIHSIEHHEAAMSVCKALIKALGSNEMDVGAKKLHSPKKISLSYNHVVLDWFNALMGQFLEDVWKKDIFKGNINSYYDLVELSLSYTSSISYMKNLEKILYPATSDHSEKEIVYSYAKKLISNLLKEENLKPLTPILTKLLQKK